jgi:hypothetical protein
MQMRWAPVVVLIGCATVIGCGSGQRTEQLSLKAKLGDAIKLTGQIVVDGNPPEKVGILALNESAVTQEVEKRQARETTTLALKGAVKADGTFFFSSYDQGDGLLAGNYVILFFKATEPGNPDPKADKFNGIYNDPTTSKFKVTLEKGKPVDMGKIELTTP